MAAKQQQRVPKKEQRRRGMKTKRMEEGRRQLK
jgi:hypothetical protein